MSKKNALLALAATSLLVFWSLSPVLAQSSGDETQTTTPDPSTEPPAQGPGASPSEPTPEPSEPGTNQSTGESGQ
jgi:hypothetical protein